MLTHILKSEYDDNFLYVVSSEGHPMKLDRRMNMKVIRKMPGAKGSVRDCKILPIDGLKDESGSATEFLFTVGCDRHMRVFDASERWSKFANFGSTYLKQRLNCLLFV